ncbi:MAG: hypothetical protein IJX07_11175 [Bacillales bacterium]|nr:hypothetical protein [Bacillales bacterium]
MQADESTNKPYIAHTNMLKVTNDPVFIEYGKLIFPIDSGYYSENTFSKEILKNHWLFAMLMEDLLM